MNLSVVGEWRHGVHFCKERGSILVSHNTIGKEGRVGDSRDEARKVITGRRHWKQAN